VDNEVEEGNVPIWAIFNFLTKLQFLPLIHALIKGELISLLVANYQFLIY